MPVATDIIMLTHNRLDHLVATLDALESRTRAPYRLTIVDNASDPEMRNWLSDQRERFHQLILRSSNEFLHSLNAGIAATESDPFMVTDPDLIVPELEPCWLTRMLDIVDRHPDFGLVGVGIDQSNLPSVQAPEVIEPDSVVDDEIVEAPVGSVFTLIRRAALRSSYETDWHTCQSVARAGYRYGWAKDIRAYHLGWDDFKLYPAHLAKKLRYGEYREVNLIERAPTLAELAVAGPVFAATRDMAIPDAAVLELTWDEPAVAAAVPGAVALERPRPGRLPLNDGAAGAVVLVDPPASQAEELLAEATRVAVRAVVAVAPLEAFGARTAAELAPDGWLGREAPGPGDLPVALARTATERADLRERVGVSTIEDRERWLSLFAQGAFGTAERRLWIWEPATAADPAESPDTVLYDPALVDPWRPVATAPQPPRRTFPERLRGRARRDVRVALELLRIQAGKARLRPRRG